MTVFKMRKKIVNCKFLNNYQISHHKYHYHKSSFFPTFGGTFKSLLFFFIILFIYFCLHWVFVAAWAPL